jgi:hypothetical protein
MVTVYIGVKDVEVRQVFTEAMFQELQQALAAAGWGGANETRQHWESDLRSRKVVAQFLRDPVLGKKRLVSMPDRLTNTVRGPGGVPRYRPTVVNCYPDDLSSTSRDTHTITN